MGELGREMRGSSDGAHATLWSAQGDEILLEILERRYALGEITRERFEEVRRWMGVSDASARVHVPATAGRSDAACTRTARPIGFLLADHSSSSHDEIQMREGTPWKRPNKLSHRRGGTLRILLWLEESNGGC